MTAMTVVMLMVIFPMLEAHVTLCEPLRHLGNMSSVSAGEPDRQPQVEIKIHLYR